MTEERPFSPAAERNREPILAVLRAGLPSAGRLLEIGAGTGQHAVYFAQALPDWTWQATDHPDALQRLRAGLAGADRPNLAPAIALDVTGTWPDGPWDAVFSANTAHIMSWPAVEKMFEGVGRVLAPAGRFFLYGPFLRGGRHHAESNAAFDADLRSRGAGMGIRDLDDLDALADRCGLSRIAELAMPANNHTLIFETTG